MIQCLNHCEYETYRAFSLESLREVVIRRYPLKLFAPERPVETILAELERVRDKDSPFLADHVGTVLEESHSLINIEGWVSGPSLRQLMDRHETISEKEARLILRGVVAGLAALARLGVHHGRLTPSKVLLCEQAPVLIDYYFWRHLPARRGDGYLPPEHGKSSALSDRYDSWAVGVLAF